MLESGDVIHYKLKGSIHRANYYNPTHTGFVIFIHDIAFAVVLKNRIVSIIPLWQFQQKYSYQNSRPEYIGSLERAVSRRIGERFKNEKEFFSEVLGLDPVENVIGYCIQLNWIQ